MAVKCTECGAALQDDSKFCRYCGAKVVQEDLKRVEVKIDNTAEIKRAEYEEKESQLRQIKMERELRKEKRKPYIIAIRVLSFLVPFGFAVFGKFEDSLMRISVILLGFLMFGIQAFLFIK